jgi:hypothetical protein
LSRLGLQGIALLLLGEALVTDEVSYIFIFYFIFWILFSLCSYVHLNERVLLPWYVGFSGVPSVAFSHRQTAVNVITAISCVATLDVLCGAQFGSQRPRPAEPAHADARGANGSARRSVQRPRPAGSGAMPSVFFVYLFIYLFIYLKFF